MTTTEDLNDTAKVIVGHLRDNGFLADGGEGQILNLAEEAGEFVGAYRRWTGRARRTGTEQEAQAELADVVITAYVTAASMGGTLNPYRFTAMPRDRVEPASAWQAVLDVFTYSARFVEAWTPAPKAGRASQMVALTATVNRSYRTAAVLGWDLNEAIAAKLDTVFTRGWRDA